MSEKEAKPRTKGARDRESGEMHGERVSGDKRAMAREEDRERRVAEQSDGEQWRCCKAVNGGGERRESAEKLALGQLLLPQREHYRRRSHRV